MARLLWKHADGHPALARAAQRVEAATLGVFWWFMARLSPQRASAFGACLFGWLGPRSAKQRHVLANLRMVCPEKDDTDIHALARGVWRNLGQMLAEYPHLGALIGREGQSPRFEIDWQGVSPDFLKDGKPRIFVAAHLGNLYFSAAALRRLGLPAVLVYSPLANPFLDRRIMRYMEVLDCGLISKQNALRPMLKALRDGRSVGLHVDVRVDGGDLFPLLGEPATTTTAPAFLSVKTGAEIVPIRCERLPEARFRVSLFPPLEAAPEGCSDKEAVNILTERMNEVIGRLIREHPDQWMCTKRRWPKPRMREKGAYDG